MKLKPIKVFGRDIPVRIDNIDDINLAAYYDPVKLEIVINTTCEDKFSSYMHEIFHSVWHRIGLSQTSIPMDVQELIVESFSVMLSENFKEIKNAEKYLNIGSGQNKKYLSKKIIKPRKKSTKK